MEKYKGRCEFALGYVRINNMELSKAYDPKNVEGKIYKLWEKSGFFDPDKLPKTAKKPFSMAMAPPNVTGSLHMGHALEYTLSDIIIRSKRMQGYKTLWLPGTDHAGIATQNAVEKELKKEGLTRHDLSREKFLERVWEWKKKYGGLIIDQLKKLGVSADWSRTRFTMDSAYQKAVETAFLHYYKNGWVYQGERVVNWCTRCQTSLSDLELEWRGIIGKLWYIRYPFKDRSGLIIVATTRPETMLGDTAVAVNPKDNRYSSLIGKTIILPLQNREIPIVADPRVEANFGTGAVKVTPAHDMLDELIAENNRLPSIKVIGEDGRMTANAGSKFEGIKTAQAREAVIKELKKLNLLEKVEDYNHGIAACYRCDTFIEPLKSRQWFLRMPELARQAIDAVKKGRVKFHPKRWEKIYFDWLKNIKDWCISRQIWWGHKIPLEGVTDVLDTWFSSSLWPFATLGWPKNTKELKNFYPTQTLTNDRGIINLWDARMIFSGIEFMGKPPFKDLIIHATILTREGKRMSKSLGTGIDPLMLIEKYGADATRFGLIWQSMGGQDIRWAEEHVVAGRKFANKIWNSARFALMQKSENTRKSQKLTVADRKILKELKKIRKEIRFRVDKYEFGQALRILYDFYWHRYCDIYLEESKKKLNARTLIHVLAESLKLLHPFLPFITEEIYQKLPLKNKKKCLMIEKWPQ